MTPIRFRALVWRYYRAHGRHELPWRQTHDLYRILVSEIMLQQTQVDRTIPLYKKFIHKFGTAKKLAAAPLSEVLKSWQGLGYNRRAKALKKAAEIIESDFAGIFPQNYEALLALPGIGQSTAGALMAFAFNKAVPFIETNIRAVYIHFFFKMLF